MFLHHDVAGDLGGAKNAMLALVDAARFRDTVEVGLVGVIPPRVELFQRQRHLEKLLSL